MATLPLGPDLRADANFNASREHPAEDPSKRTIDCRRPKGTVI